MQGKGQFLRARLSLDDFLTKGMKAAFPNALTLGNLISGAIAFLCLSYGQSDLAVWLVGVSLLADFFDGALARRLGVSSPLGKELDSLADVVSFGIVPGMIFYGLISASLSRGAWPEGLHIHALPAFVLSAFAALRLGKFNLDERQQHGFIGLPTPSVTLFSVGLLLAYEKGILEAWFNPWVLYALVAVLCWLMHAPVPMFSLKFKSAGWVGNEIKYIFVLVSLVLLFLFKGVAFAGIISMYVGLSVGLYLWKRKNSI